MHMSVLNTIFLTKKKSKISPGAQIGSYLHDTGQYSLQDYTILHEGGPKMLGTCVITTTLLLSQVVIWQLCVCGVTGLHY